MIRTKSDGLCEWLASEEKILVSHDDLDGYGCRIMINIMNFMYASTSYRHRNVGNPKQIMEAIDDIINTTNVRTDRFNVLVTDLHMSAADALLLHERFPGMRLMIVDHHLDPAGDVAALADLDWCIYDLDHETSSTLHLWNMFSNVIRYMDPTIEVSNDLLRMGREYAEAVSRYDLGKWESWTTDNRLDPDPRRSIDQQMYFVHCRREGNAERLDRYVGDITRMIIGYNNASSAGWFSKFAFAYLNESARLFDEYHDLLKRIRYGTTHTSTSEIWIPSDISLEVDGHGLGSGCALRIDWPSYKVGTAFIERAEDHPQYFSIVSREILENGFCDLLVLVNFGRGTVELRSVAGGPIDCSRIAVGYGGGGHQAAAGFPIGRICIDDDRSIPMVTFKGNLK